MEVVTALNAAAESKTHNDLQNSEINDKDNVVLDTMLEAPDGGHANFDDDFDEMTR